jgi:hypothetical protein
LSRLQWQTVRYQTSAGLGTTLTVPRMLLQEQEMTRYDTFNDIRGGIKKAETPQFTLRIGTRRQVTLSKVRFSTPTPRRSLGRVRMAIRLLLVGAPAAINATLYDKLNFNFIPDIAPVASVADSCRAGRWPARVSQGTQAE